MFKRKISKNDIHMALEHYKAVEEYPDDEPFPSRLVFGFSGIRPLHIVFAENRGADERIIITAYEPDLEHWHNDFRVFWRICG